jgi:hypothetical protein
MHRMYLMVIILATLTVPMMTASPAHAEVYYPWCAYYSGRDGGGATNCGFVSWSQCMATVSGIGGYCGPSPRYFAHCRRNCADPGSLTAVRPPIRQRW